MAKKAINDFTDKELADMVRNSCYVQHRTFGNETHQERFLLVLAIPYGPDSNALDLTGAITEFRRYVRDADWKERVFQVYDHETQTFFSSSMEEAEARPSWTEVEA